MNERDEGNSPLGDAYDRVIRQLTGLPDTIATKPSTIATLTPMLSLAQTWIVQTYRQRDRGGDTAKSKDVIFLQYIDAQGGKRFVIPPDVADAIARQRDALSAKNRSKSARERASERKAAGLAPAFTKNPNRGRKAKGKTKP